MAISLSRDILTVDNFIHATTGALFVMIVAKMAPALSVVVFVTVFGLWREWTQHSADVPIWNPHRVLEGAAWGAGGLAVIPLA